MTLQLVTFIYDIFLYAKCYVIHIVLDRIKSNKINDSIIILEKDWEKEQSLQIQIGPRDI